MTGLRRLAAVRLCSDAAALRAVQLFCFAAAPLLFMTALIAVGRHATTPGEIVNGLLAASAATLSIVVMGLVVPLAERSKA